MTFRKLHGRGMTMHFGRLDGRERVKWNWFVMISEGKSLQKHKRGVVSDERKKWVKINFDWLEGNHRIFQQIVEPGMHLEGKREVEVRVSNQFRKFLFPKLSFVYRNQNVGRKPKRLLPKAWEFRLKCLQRKPLLIYDFKSRQLWNAKPIYHVVHRLISWNCLQTREFERYLDLVGLRLKVFWCLCYFKFVEEISQKSSKRITKYDSVYASATFCACVEMSLPAWKRNIAFSVPSHFRVPRNMKFSSFFPTKFQFIISSRHCCAS